MALGGIVSAISGPVANIGGAIIERNWARRDAQRQMDFQQWMSSTSHQRAVEDLKAAGLNPLLAVNNGASSPSGALAAPVKIGEGLSGSLRDAQRIKNEQEQIQLNETRLKEETGLIRAQKQKATVEAIAAAKEIPTSELRNTIFNLFKPIIDGMNESSAKRLKKLDLPNKPRLERIIP